MSTSNIYLPIPPRVWSRVQNQCTYTLDSLYNPVYIPLTGKTTTLSQANIYQQILYKGNILQYKGNSSQLTKSQKYSQISKGFAPGRKKVFATQTQTYTNPNTTSLKRVNYTEIPFPNQIVGAPNNISGPYQYGIPNPFDCPSNSLQDGGNLVCNAYVNPCSNEVIENITSVQCFPTYCSDVPGFPIDLCWNPKVQTWFPRQRYNMNNSLSKWPEGYKGFVSAVRQVAPVLTISSYTTSSVTLNWTYNNGCIPFSTFSIYQNGGLINNVSPYIKSATITGLTSDTYSFYILANNNTQPSNTVTISL